MGGGDCFVKGTEIETIHGPVKIEDVKIGDRVLTYNGKISAQEVLGTMTQLHTGEDNDFMVQIIFENGIKNINTNTHPYFIKGIGWASWVPEETKRRYDMDVYQLQVGDMALMFNGEDVEEVQIISIEEDRKPTVTYNLHKVANNHNFFANKVLVHNKGGGDSADADTSGFGGSFGADALGGDPAGFGAGVAGDFGGMSGGIGVEGGGGSTGGDATGAGVSSADAAGLGGLSADTSSADTTGSSDVAGDVAGLGGLSSDAGLGSTSADQSSAGEAMGADISGMSGGMSAAGLGSGFSWGGAAKGALTGAKAGSAAGPFGSFAGGILGGIFGGFNSADPDAVGVVGSLGESSSSGFGSDPAGFGEGVNGPEGGPGVGGGPGDYTDVRNQNQNNSLITTDTGDEEETNTEDTGNNTGGNTNDEGTNTVNEYLEKLRRRREERFGYLETRQFEGGDNTDIFIPTAWGTGGAGTLDIDTEDEDIAFIFG